MQHLIYIAKCSVPSCVVVIYSDQNGERKRKEAVHHKAFYKIGMTASLTSRLHALQTGCPLKIEIIATMKMPSRLSALELEGMLHWRYAKRQTVGEWFSLRGDHISMLLRMADEWPVTDPMRFLGPIDQYPAPTLHIVKKVV